MDITHWLTGENCPLGQILGGQYSDTIAVSYTVKLSFYFVRKLGKLREPHITDWSL